MKSYRLFSIAGFVVSILFLLPADVTPIFNREYFPTLHKVLQEAEESIHILMFTARIYPKYPDDVNSIILQDLIDARRRGVEVTVILEASDWNYSNTVKNKMFGDSLKKAGVNVFYDPFDVTSHDKLVIVDGYITIVGSTNWSYYALERNNEASVLIKSKEVAETFEEHFQDVLRLSTETVPKEALE